LSRNTFRQHEPVADDGYLLHSLIPFRMVRRARGKRVPYGTQRGPRLSIGWEGLVETADDIGIGRFSRPLVGQTQSRMQVSMSS
jgi:hypothetical protein